MHAVQRVAKGLKGPGSAPYTRSRSPTRAPLVPSLRFEMSIDAESEKLQPAARVRHAHVIAAGQAPAASAQPAGMRAFTAAAKASIAPASV